MVFGDWVGNRFGRAKKKQSRQWRLIAEWEGGRGFMRKRGRGSLGWERLRKIQ